MKKTAVFGIALGLVLALSVGSALAGNAAGGVKLSGPHFQFSLIGHPNNNFSGDYSNGRAIMVPLKTDNSGPQLVCKYDGVKIVDDISPTTKTSVMGGVRLYFEPSNQVGQFTIVDRDALDDGEAKILFPDTLLNADGSIKFDIYIRALGKPNTCMNINAYAYDDAQQLYFYAGSAYISRKAGKSFFVKANDLFDVHWCEVDTVTNQCTSVIDEISVFADYFSEYFWQILNDGSRNVQVRIYY